MNTVAYVTDLMDRSRFPSSASVAFVRTGVDLVAQAGSADLVVADLNLPGAFDALAEVGDDVKRVGYTHHENTELIAAATAKGIEALPRSRFFMRITQLVTSD